MEIINYAFNLLKIYNSLFISFSENSILTLKSSTGDFETIHHNKRLPLIFNTIAKGYYAISVIN